MTYLINSVLQRIAVVTFAIAAVALVTVTLLAAVGVLPWLSFEVTIGDTVYTNAGQITQIAGTILAVLFCSYLPANARVMRLEASHRNFTIGMQDVAKAYAYAHAADRASTFKLSSEFDAIRERLVYLRDHPDLSNLEPELLEVAAQMSYVSKELAEVYADEKVERARDFLRQRQQELDIFNNRLVEAKHVTSEMRHWLHEVELEESVAASQLDRLRDQITEILPEVGIAEMQRNDGTIVKLPTQAAE